MAVTVEEKLASVQGRPPSWTIKSDKFNHEFRVEKTFDGFVFFHITVSSGSLPQELQGRYMKATDAIKAVMSYEATAKPSATVERDRKAARRVAQKEEI